MSTWKKFGVALLAVMLISGMATAADVTFQVNMAQQERLAAFDRDAGDIVIVRGSFNDWTGTTDELTAATVEDSVFTGTVTIAEGDITYKFVIVPGVGEEVYESVAADRAYTVVGTDPVTLPVVYFSDDDGRVAVNVTFQVNMGVQEFWTAFDPAVDGVVIRGSFNDWGEWSTGVDLVMTNDDVNDSTVWKGTAQIQSGDIEYKYVIKFADPEAPVKGETIANRVYTVTEDADQTIEVAYFDDASSYDPVTQIEIDFRVNMGVQIIGGNFDPSVDLVVVRGSHTNIGMWGGEIELAAEVLDPNVYSLKIPFDNIPTGQTLYYKFVRVEGGSGGTEHWEQPTLDVLDGNRYYVPTGLETDADENGYGDVDLDLVYFSDVDPAGIIEHDIDVTFAVDTRTAYYKIADPDSEIVDVQSGDPVTEITSTELAGFFNNWPWGSFPVEYVMMDDGIAPDETAGDSIFSVIYTFTAGSATRQEYKYGLNGLDVEAGFAQNHELNMDKELTEIAVLDTFGANGTLYDPYIEILLNVREVPMAAVPESFSLKQNYPNPFNPTTNISFTIPETGKTVLRVYNLQGQEVLRSELGELNAGAYEFTLDASMLASGVYFYRIESGRYGDSKKMILLK